MSVGSLPPRLSLDVRGLAIGRGGRTLASGMDFSAASGEAIAVTGPNGAGKSTLLRTLAGLLAPLGGIIEMTGGGFETGAEAGACAHYLGHDDALKGALSVRENLKFWAEALDIGQGGLEIPAAIAQIGLPHVADFPAGFLSAGQKRRVALARLLVAHRPVWLLDEPTSALDAASQARFAALMRGHLDRGGIIVAATHAPLGLEGARELRLETKAPA